jgi:hypothetical protein
MAQTYYPVILAISKVEIGRIMVQGQPRKKVQETPSPPIKAGCGEACLSSQLLWKHKREDCGPGWPKLTKAKRSRESGSSGRASA